MRVLALDASSKSGWALFVDGKLDSSGALPGVPIEDFNVNKDPHLSSKYPYNIVEGAQRVATAIQALVEKCGVLDVVVIENTNKGKNRHTQRFLEFMHFCILMMLRQLPQTMTYMDTSEWRSYVGLWMTKEDKKNNRDVSAGKKRGKITKKHLAVRTVNARYGLTLKQKDNDQADAILLGEAYIKKRESQAS